MLQPMYGGEDTITTTQLYSYLAVNAVLIIMDLVATKTHARSLTPDDLVEPYDRVVCPAVNPCHNARHLDP